MQAQGQFVLHIGCFSGSMFRTDVQQGAVYDIPSFVFSAVHYTPYNAPVLLCQELSECDAEQLA